MELTEEDINIINRGVYKTQLDKLEPELKMIFSINYINYLKHGSKLIRWNRI